MTKPKLIVFASGEKDGGGSGFENLFAATQGGALNAEIVAVVSNHERGGVRERADRLGIPFHHFKGPFPKWSLSEEEKEPLQKEIDAEALRIIKKYNAEWVSFSGWLKLIRSLDPRKTINIHPALLSQLDGRFGGDGMYGKHVHRAVKEALDNGEINMSGVTMHFVTGEYDRGPVFFEIGVPLVSGMTADEIGSAVNQIEHTWQPHITNLVITGLISWDGKDPSSLVFPADYNYLL